MLLFTPFTVTPHPLLIAFAAPAGDLLDSGKKIQVRLSVPE